MRICGGLRCKMRHKQKPQERSTRWKVQVGIYCKHSAFDCGGSTRHSSFGGRFYAKAADVVCLPSCPAAMQAVVGSQWLRVKPFKPSKDFVKHPQVDLFDGEDGHWKMPHSRCLSGEMPESWELLDGPRELCSEILMSCIGYMCILAAIDLVRRRSL